MNADVVDLACVTPGESGASMLVDSLSSSTWSCAREGCSAPSVAKSGLADESGSTVDFYVDGRILRSVCLLT